MEKTIQDMDRYRTPSTPNEGFSAAADAMGVLDIPI
jgi:hypothetical protein